MGRQAKERRGGATAAASKRREGQRRGERLGGLAMVFLIDTGMGLINRFAERLNVSFLSNSIKSLAAVAMVLLMLLTMLEVLVRNLDANAEETLGLVRTLFAG